MPRHRLSQIDTRDAHGAPILGHEHIIQFIINTQHGRRQFDAAAFLQTYSPVPLELYNLTRITINDLDASTSMQLDYFAMQMFGINRNCLVIGSNEFDLDHCRISFTLNIIIRS
jgi:hypothetical protein